ncbi:MAG: cysteine synthase A [Chloroflexi bacterium]|nr:cysteine synthase A [Chloroflexota bacterium]MCL5075415.1 cysteine synthase A [Chloroflexota bacterium]
MSLHVGSSILELIGQTPIVQLRRLARDIDAQVYAKIEAVNIGGSVKSRTALGMIELAEKQGGLKPGMTIVEATTGNQGIAIAMIAAVKGYKAIIVMPERYSKERVKIMKAYGAQVLLSPEGKDMHETVWMAREKAFEMERNDPENVVYLKQFDNPGNVAIHRRMTAAEILMQMGDKIDAFVSTIGTGGTLTGVAEVLKAVIPSIRIVGVEPYMAALEGTGRVGKHRQEGIGDGQTTRILNRAIVDEWIAVTDEDAFETARRLAREEGLLCGISSGTAAWAAMEVAKRMGAGRVVLTILPDTGERYLQTDLFGE